MNQITTMGGAGTLAPVTPQVAISPELRARLSDALEPTYPPAPGEEFGLRKTPIALTGKEAEEADWVAFELDRLLSRAVAPQTVAAWLKVVNAAVRNPQTKEDFQAKAAAIAMVCDGLPEACFTAESQRQAMAKWQFFPSAADVVAAVQPIADEWRRKAAALRRMPRGRQIQADQDDVVPMPDEVRAAFSARMKALRGELLAQERARYAPADERPKTAYLTPDQSKAAFAKIAQGGGPFAGAAQTALKNLHGEQGA